MNLQTFNAKRREIKTKSSRLHAAGSAEFTLILATHLLKCSCTSSWSQSGFKYSEIHGQSPQPISANLPILLSLSALSLSQRSVSLSAPSLSALSHSVLSLSAMAMKLRIGLVLVMVLIIAEAEGMQEGLRMSRFLAENKPKAVKCKKYPEVCVTDKNSAGPYCCKNKCVNVLTDNHNCGRCKHKCKFSTGCCNGICSNLAFDTSNCGRCGNKCKNGALCAYGMCSYN